MNGVDLSLFDYNYDLTWMGFFLNPDEHIYSRYGGRAEQDAMTLLSPAGLKRTMLNVMDEHVSWLENPTPPPPKRQVTTIDELPLAKEALERAEREGRTDQCFHCHNVNDYRMRQQIADGTFDRNFIFSYPPPRTLGFRIDRQDSTRVESVEDDSAAATAGLRPDDRIRSIGERKILSVGDLLYALNKAPLTGTLQMKVARGDETLDLAIPLADGWREHDISWRAKLWNIQPEPGVWAPEISEDRRKELGIADTELALEARYIHKPWARQSGLQNGDIIIASNGDTTRRAGNQWQAHVRLNSQPGSNLVLTVIRGEERKEIRIKLPE